MSVERDALAEVLASHAPVLRQAETGLGHLAGCTCEAPLPPSPDWGHFALHLAEAVEGCPGDPSTFVERDPYDKVVRTQGHSHSEPICAWPDCQTFLTREQMAALPDA